MEAKAEKMDAFMNCVIRVRGVYQWPRSVSSDWDDAGSEESCVPTNSESKSHLCRRVSPSIKALTSATRPYKLDEKHYSKLVLLGRSLAAPVEVKRGVHRRKCGRHRKYSLAGSRVVTPRRAQMASCN